VSFCIIFLNAHCPKGLIIRTMVYKDKEKEQRKDKRENEIIS